LRSGGVFPTTCSNPFSEKYGTGFDAGAEKDGEWFLLDKVQKYNEIFMKHQLCDGKIAASEARKVVCNFRNKLILSDQNTDHFILVWALFKNSLQNIYAVSGK